MENMRHNIIFVGGIHGVGKTTLCEHLCSKLNIEHHSASSLISKIKQVEFSSNKQTSDVKENQDDLIVAINKFLSPNKHYLLDGHFCLLDTHKNVIKIPKSTYTAMSPIAIILLHDDITNIYSRLAGRDKEHHSMDLLELFQEKEISYSKTISEDLGIPYLKANPFKEKEIIFDFVAKLLTEEDLT
jgi:adenylate kinase